MNDYKCPNAIFEYNGISHSIKCKAFNNDYCGCVRYCPTTRRIEHNDMAQYCLKNPQRKEKESERSEK